MINKDNCILLGTLSRPHGTGGSLQIRFSGLKAGDIKDKGTVFVEVDGLPVPFFIEDFREKADDTAILKFEGIDSETRAREFTGYSVYVMKGQVRRRGSKTEGLPELQGYSVVDDRAGFVGYAGRVTLASVNPLLVVEHEGREFLVPYHEDIIRAVDHDEKVIRINAPEGLFDL